MLQRGASSSQRRWITQRCRFPNRNQPKQEGRSEYASYGARHVQFDEENLKRRGRVFILIDERHSVSQFLRPALAIRQHSIPSDRHNTATREKNPSPHLHSLAFQRVQIIPQHHHAMLHLLHLRLDALPPREAVLNLCARMNHFLFT